MAGFKNRIVTTVDLVATGARKGFADLKADVKNADGAFGKLKATGAGAMTLLKQNAILAGAAIGTALVGGAAKAIAAASNLEESANAVDKVYGSASESVQKVGEDAADSMGLSQRAFNEAAVAFGAFAKQIAGDGGNVAGTVETFTQRAADFASVMNLDVSESLRIFQSALAGETEPIRKFGINLSAAAVQAHALAEGMIVSGQTMDDATKVQARYSLLMKSTANTAGDFADTSDGLANSQRRLQANIENLAAKLGDSLIPVAESATETLLKFVEVAERFKVPEALQAMGTMLQLVSGDIHATRIELDGLTEAELAHRVALMKQGATLQDAKEAWDRLEDNLSRTTEAYDDVQTAITNAATEQRIASATAKDLAGSESQVRAAVEAATKAHEANEAALRESERVLRAAEKAVTDLNDANRDMADSVMDAEEALWDQIEAVQRVNEVLADEDATLIDVARELNNAVRATDAAVVAAEGLTEESLNTAAGMHAWTRGMMAAGSEMSGPLANEIIDHIGRVNGIPDEKITEIKANTGDTLRKLAILDAEINRVTRDRTVRVHVQPTGGGFSGGNSVWDRGAGPQGPVSVAPVRGDLGRGSGVSVTLVVQSGAIVTPNDIEQWARTELAPIFDRINREQGRHNG